MPEDLVFSGYELDKEQSRAILFYEYGTQIIQYSMYMNNVDSSYGRTEPDQLVDEYQIEIQNRITVDIKECTVVNHDNSRYVAEFEYNDVQYQLIGVMEKEEFEKIIKNLYFSNENA